MKKIYSYILFASVILLAPTFLAAQGKKQSAGNADYKPVVLVSASESASATAPLTYINSIRKGGGAPVVIPMTTDEKQIAALLDIADAVVMTGGEDLDPLKCYGEEPIRAQGEIVPVRDTFDIMLIRMAVERGIPLLGICRGEQVLNVVFGGTLYQDIPSQAEGSYIKHRQSAPSSYGTHTISIEEGSLLHRQLGASEMVVNSFHHQAVKDVAPGFRAVAYSKDGIIEAIQKEGCDNVWGVQFHPEGFVSGGNDDFLGIFTYLIEKAKEYRASKK